MTGCSGFCSVSVRRVDHRPSLSSVSSYILGWSNRALSISLRPGRGCNSRPLTVCSVFAFFSSPSRPNCSYACPRPARLWRCWEVPVRRRNLSSCRHYAAGRPCQISWFRGFGLLCALNVIEGCWSPVSRGLFCLPLCLCPLLSGGLIPVELPVCCRPGRPGCRLGSAPHLSLCRSSGSLSLGPLFMPTTLSTPGALCLPPSADVGMPCINARPRCIHNRSAVASRMISTPYSRPGTCEMKCDVLGPPPLSVSRLTHVTGTLATKILHVFS